MTIISTHNEKKKGNRRCDKRCYDAKHNKECDCVCGGDNHGKGLQTAVFNAMGKYRDWVQAEIGRGRKPKMIKTEVAVLKQIFETNYQYNIFTIGTKPDERN